MNRFKNRNQFFFKDKVFNFISLPKLNILKEYYTSHLKDIPNCGIIKIKAFLSLHIANKVATNSFGFQFIFMWLVGPYQS